MADVKTFRYAGWLALSVLLVLRPAESQETRSPLHADLSRTYGYVSGQRFSIERIRRELPTLADSALKAQMEFDLLFRPASDNVERELQKLMGQRWTDLKGQMDRQLATHLGSSAMSHGQAVAFIAEVASRAKGKIDTPVLEILLSYHPQFRENPAKEFLGGFKSTFRTKDHPKAKEVDFQIQYPRSWRAKEGERPNVVQIITSENGRGFESIVLLVRDIALSASQVEAERDELFSPHGLKGMVPDGASLIVTQPIILDRQKGGMIVFDQSVQRLDVKILMRSMQFVTLFKNKLIIVQCMAATQDANPAALQDRFQRLEPLFKLVANSFVLQSQY